MTDLKVRYSAWKFLQPEPGSSCCPNEHVFLERPRPDHQVCEREAAWRKYVRLRDCNPEYPMNIKSLD